MDCVTWLHSANEKLAACGDTSGDKESIQSQLDKLHVSNLVHSTLFWCLRIIEEFEGHVPWPQMAIY